MGYDFGAFENLDAGRDSIMVVEANRNRNFFQLVAQAERDFGQYLASAEDDQDLMDRVAAVEAELREAGVNDPVSVLEALAAKGEDDDTDSDDDDADDDSDVPDFVDTDEDDSKDRKESKVASGYAPSDLPSQADSQNLQETGFQDPARVMRQQPEGIPGAGAGAIPGASPHPVVPRGVNPNPAAGAMSPTTLPPADQFGVPQRSASVLPFVPRKK